MGKGSVSDGVVFHAGFPNAGEDGLGSLSLDKLAIRHRASTFLWRLNELGIAELHWQGGSVVVVDRALSPRNGDYVVAIIEEDFMVRQMHGKQLVMPNGQPETSEQISIWGVITHVLQEYR